MSVQFTDKGKFFTDIVFKDKLTATIQTARCRIHGTVYLHRETRLIDELNVADQFLAITDAVVLNDNDEVLYKSEFITVNRDHIIWLLPYEEEAGTETPTAGDPA